MTISYTLEQVSSSDFASFTRLLFHWHGSIWKNVYKELTVWVIIYALISAIYRLVLSESQKRFFEDMVDYCDKNSGVFPLTLMLGFFVTIVVQRWWQMFNHFGWIENTALYVATYINGTDERSKIIRRNIVRYTVLNEAMVFRDVSPVVRRRFPDDDAFKTAGFLTENELIAINNVTSLHGKYWLPIYWSFNLIKQAKLTGNIETNRACELLHERLRKFRTSLSRLRAFSWVPVPLAYTQVVFLAVRCYLAMTLVGSQYIHSDQHKHLSTPVDIYVPFLTILHFIFNLGWMKVAEALLNPFGDDDDDFELNWIIDRNLQIGLSIVDDAIGKEPPLEKDFFWDDVTPEPLYLFGSCNVPLHHQNQTEVEKAARNLLDTLKSPFRSLPEKNNENNNSKLKKKKEPTLQADDFLQGTTKVLLNVDEASIYSSYDSDSVWFPEESARTTVLCLETGSVIHRNGQFPDGHV